MTGTYTKAEKKKLNRNDRDVVNDNRERKEEGLAPFKEGIVEITEQSEVPVVSKQTRVVEEVSVNKDVIERDEKVKNTVRRNEVEVEHLDENE